MVLLFVAVHIGFRYCQKKVLLALLEATAVVVVDFFVVVVANIVIAIVVIAWFAVIDHIIFDCSQ